MSAEDINMFCSYFEQQIHNVAQLQDGMYPRILWVTMLDSISIAAHPNLARKNHDRIIKFIESYTQWGDQDRTSLPQMALQLKNARLTNGKLYENVTNEIDRWPHGRILGPDVDPQFEEIVNLAYCDCERKIIKGCRYKELFYISRNYLVHEFRDPGHGSRGLSSRDSAFYHKYSSRWELVFPTALFRNFCSQGLTNLKTALERDNRNPYDAYKFRSNW